MANFPGPRARRMVVAMKAESSYGVDILAGSYVSGDIIPAYGMDFTADPREIENLAQGGQLGRLPSIIGLPTAALTFSMWLRGKGAAYSASVKPESDLPLRACGLSSVFSGGAGTEIVTYVPTDTHEAMTAYVVQENGPAFKMGGAFANVSIEMTAGGVAVARFSLGGKNYGEADVSFTAGSPSATPAYPVMKSAAFQISSENYAPRFSRVGFDMGNVLSAADAGNDATSVAGYFIADRKPLITLDPEAATVAVFPWYTKWSAGTLMDMSFQQGTVQYDRILFSMAQTQLLRKGISVRQNLTVMPMSLLASLAAGNDDFSIVFS